MGKNAKIIIFSLIGLAVLGGVAALLMLTAPEKTETPSVGADLSAPVSSSDGVELTLCDRAENEVASVEVTNVNGTFAITPSGNTDSEGSILWTIADIAEAPLETDSLSTAVGYASSVEAKEFAEEIDDSSELAKYGLDKPAATIKTTFTDGTTFSYKVGNEVPNSTTAVYMTADDKNVFTIYRSRVSSYFGNKYSFVSLTAIPVYDQSSGEEVKKLTVSSEGMDEPIVLENILTDDEDAIQVYSYRMVSPYSAYADLNDGPAYAYAVFGLNASEVSAVGKDAGTAIKENVTDEVWGRVVAETNFKTYTVTFGKAKYVTETGEDGTTRDIFAGRYGITDEHPGVLYFFDAATLASLYPDPTTLISKLFLMPYIYSLKSIDYSDNAGHKLELGIELIEKAEANKDAVTRFTANGETVDEQQFKDLYQYLISAAGEELYLDADRGELIAEIVYNYIDPADGIGGKDVVQLYNSNSDRKVIIALNGENLFKTRQLYATQLFSNIDNFLSGSEIVLTY